METYSYQPIDGRAVIYATAIPKFVIQGICSIAFVRIRFLILITMLLLAHWSANIFLVIVLERVVWWWVEICHSKNRRWLKEQPCGRYWLNKSFLWERWRLELLRERCIKIFVRQQIVIPSDPPYYLYYSGKTDSWWLLTIIHIPWHFV